jgi:hypothetical protein
MRGGIANRVAPSSTARLPGPRQTARQSASPCQAQSALPATPGQALAAALFHRQTGRLAADDVNDTAGRIELYLGQDVVELEGGERGDPRPSSDAFVSLAGDRPEPSRPASWTAP